MTASRRPGLAEIGRLVRLFARRQRLRWVARAGFETSRDIAVGDEPWRVCYAIHVIPAGPRGVELKSSITLWPAATRKRPGWRRGGRSPTLRAKGWYETCRRRLGQHGYAGRWQASPWGRFGSFWKPLKDTAAVSAEIAALERLPAALFRVDRPGR
jgi:hypothetical protein